jgi:hypothetical protein
MNRSEFEERGLLEGKYSLKIGIKPVEPEVFLGLVEGKDYYQDIRKFVRRVDNDTGIPFLTKEEYMASRRILPLRLRVEHDNKGIISAYKDRIYLRGRRYYLNYNPILGTFSNQDFSINAFHLLKESLINSIDRYHEFLGIAPIAVTIDERMILSSYLDQYKNHLLVLFTGLFESMLKNDKIDLAHYNLLREYIERAIGDYYAYLILCVNPREAIPEDTLQLAFDDVENVIRKTPQKDQRGANNQALNWNIYDNRRYLAREFDHPGRLILYACNLLSQLQNTRKRYDLIVNMLNGSAEVGLGVQSIDRMLNANKIETLSIYDVDYCRYSRKDRKNLDLDDYCNFEKIALPKQLRINFRQKAESNDILLMDDNLNTGQSLYNVRKVLAKIANSVDLSVIEITPYKRIIEILRKGESADQDIQKNIYIKESDLTYSPIAWWRDQIELNKNQTIEKMIGFKNNGIKDR